MGTDLIFCYDSYTKKTSAQILSVTSSGFVADRSVFYCAGGGQPGDQGVVLWRGGAAKIIDTIKGDPPESIIHVLAPGDLPPPIGAEVALEIDWERRHRHMRMHTALHLLCAVVPGQVTGGQIGHERSRLDFNVPTESLDRGEIEARLTELIKADLPVTILSITEDELVHRPELVRTAAVKPPIGQGLVRMVKIADVDYQPCGGTHVATTGEVGNIAVTKIESKGRQNRRIVLTLP